MKSASAAVSAPIPSKPAPAGKFEIKRRSAGFLAIHFKTTYYERGRLINGATQLLCLEHVLSETVSASRPEGSPAPEWSRPIPTEEFAAVCHEKSLRTVQAALDDLCDRKVIARRMVKRGEYAYSAPVETWQKLPAAKAEKKPVDSADSLDSDGDTIEDQGQDQSDLRRKKLRPDSLPPDGPLIVNPGQPTPRIEYRAKVEGKIQPVPMEGYQILFGPGVPALAHEVEMHRGFARMRFELASNDASADKRLGKFSAENCAENGTSTDKRLGKFSAENCAENGTSTENTEVSRAVAARAAPLKAAVSRREETNEMGLWRDAMNRWFRPTLGPVPDDIVRQAISGAGVATREDCLRKLEVRKARGFCKTWGGVVLVIREVGEAAAKARPVQSTNGHRPGESAADIEARRREDQLDTLRVALRFIDELPEHPDAIAQRELVQAADPILLEQARATL